jgi:threonine dehydratase
VVAPIGGGGMISGTCLTLSTLAPGIEVYAAEPRAGRRCLPQLQGRAYHRRRRARDGGRRAEGAAEGPDLAFREKHVTDILTATEDEIVEAMKLIWKRMKIVMEPSSAVPLAAILKNPQVFPASVSVSSSPAATSISTNCPG